MWSKVNHWLKDFDQKQTANPLISDLVLDSESDMALKAFREK